MQNIVVVLDTRRQLNDGSYPLKLRYYDGKTHYYLKVHNLCLRMEDWDQRQRQVKLSHSCSKEYNLLIDSCLLEANQRYIQHLMKHGVNKGFTLKAKDEDSLDFYAYFRTVIHRLQKENRHGTASALGDALSKLSKLHLKPLKMPEITPNKLLQWESEMRSEGLKTNAIASYMRSIRSVYNRAIKCTYSNQSEPKRHFPKLEF